MNAKTASARSARQPVRETEVRSEGEREPVRAKVRARKGAGTDRLHIPQEMIPDGIDLQWVTDSVLGQPAVQDRMSYEVNAWEPVTPDMFDARFDGIFMPKGHKGEINVGGLVLMWRPLELTLEARAEERQAANMQIRTETNKMITGQVDGVDSRILGVDKAKTFMTKERIPSMPVP
jgi:hypothetical protein